MSTASTKILFLLCLLCEVGYSQDQLTVGSLLREMTDRGQLTYYPNPSYTLGQFSSYDRRSVSPIDSNWFANEDYSRFIRADSTQGRRELVMFDAEGPGAIVRWWMTFAGKGGNRGVLRIYIDGNLVVSDSILHVLAGNLLAEYPLQASLSPDTDRDKQGHNLYFPIPYQSSCKITYTCDAIQYPSPESDPKVYYNINYRSYSPGTAVKSFSLQQLQTYSDEIEDALKTLADDPYSPPNQVDHLINSHIPPDSAIILPFLGQGALNSIQLALEAADRDQALRSTVIQISFDGFPSVWVPIGDFFGTGFQLHPYRAWATQLSEAGMLTSRWVMPYQYKAEVSLINYGKQPVTVRGNVGTIPYTWEETRSMYFGANWIERNGYMPAGILNPSPKDRPEDFTFVELNGQGVYVGDVLTLFNSDDAWWGEGDEKIYIDGESFPTIFGTGTEDYYGYAWARPEAFSHPFVAQPSGAGNFFPGLTINLRQRSLDAIPFQSQLRVDMELLHWVSTPINYASTSFFYTLSPYLAPKVEQAESVQLYVPKEREDLVPIYVDSTGFIEGEHLRVNHKKGRSTRTQYDPSIGWSNQGQLWWTGAEPGDTLHLGFKVKASGRYWLTAGMSQAKDYGKVTFGLNGGELPVEFDGFCAEGISPQILSLGEVYLEAGLQELILICLEKEKDTVQGFMAGIDWLRVKKMR